MRPGKVLLIGPWQDGTAEELLEKLDSFLKASENAEMISSTEIIPEKDMLRITLASDLLVFKMAPLVRRLAHQVKAIDTKIPVDLEQDLTLAGKF